MNEYIPGEKVERTGSLWPSALLLFLGFGLGIAFGYTMRQPTIAVLEHKALSLEFYKEGYKIAAIYQGFLAEGGTAEEWYDRGTRVRAIDEYSKRYHKNITEYMLPMILKEMKDAHARGNWDNFQLDEEVD